MAGRKEVSETVNPDVDYKEKSELLEKEVADLKKMFETLMANQQQPKSQEVKQEIVEEYDEAKIIPPTQFINVTSLFYGGMTLKGNREKPIRFERFGMTLPISYDDLTHICTQQRHLAENGSFIIHNKDAIKALYLEESYTKIITKDMIENLIDLPDEEIRHIVKMTTKGIKETIVDVVLAGVKKHILEGDMKFSNRNKVTLIGELCGQDIYKTANYQLELDK